jgi:ubiquinone/menaquinone biosynthesis C-methylase UbiE
LSEIKRLGVNILTTEEKHSQIEQETVRTVYETMADEYDERIPGITPNDRRFTETENAFLLSKITANDVVLDMGCGTGRFTLPTANIARKVTGLDLSSAMIAKARQKAESLALDIDFLEADMAHMPFADASFDVVVCMLALMHIPLEKRQQVFHEAKRVLRPGGTLLFSVKNALFERMSTSDRFATVDITDVEHKQLVFTQTRSGQEIKAPWYSFAPQDLTRLCAIAGLHLVHMRGNTPLSAWLSDNILEGQGVYEMVRLFENTLGDVPPFNYLGYHLLVEAIKPMG